MNSQSDSFAFQSDQVIKVEHQIYKTIAHSIAPFEDQHSMTITFMDDFNDPNRSSIVPHNELLKVILEQDQQISEKSICIDPLCFQQSRTIMSEESHKGHKTISLKTLLGNLTVLKCNVKHTQQQKDKVDQMFNELDQIYNSIGKFQRDVLNSIKTLKVKTQEHITEVKQSFGQAHYNYFRKNIQQNFDFPTVSHALVEIDKYQALKYDNLGYPNFKMSMIVDRIQQSAKKYKNECLEYLKKWVHFLQGNHKNYTKMFNRSVETFMYKSTSEKRLFSYYLLSPDYKVSEMGKKLNRIKCSFQLPLAMVQKKLQTDKILIKVNRIGPCGISIGCGVLRQIEKKGFDNCYEKGFFVHSNGIIFSQQKQTKNIFKFGKGDIISLHRQDSRIYFHKYNNNYDPQGFYVNLKPFEAEGVLSSNLDYYVGAFIGDKEGSLQILK